MLVCISWLDDVDNAQLIADIQGDNSGESLTIGAVAFNPSAFGNHCRGALDEVAIYDKALTERQILELPCCRLRVASRTDIRRLRLRREDRRLT